MKFKGNNPVKETVHPDPEQKNERYPRLVRNNGKTVESITANEDKDGSGPIEQDLADTEKTYSGRSEDDVSGAQPSDPPEHDTLPLHTLRKPKTPPKNNI